MANNCLVTKLKGTVDNKNLPKLGEFIIHTTQRTITNPSLQQGLGIGCKAGEQVAVRILGNGYLADTVEGLEGSTLKEYIVTSPGKKLFFTNGNYDIYIGNKYNCPIISTNDTENNYKPIFQLNLDELAYSPLTILSAYFTDTYGSIDSFKNITTLERIELTLADHEASGNIESLLGSKDVLQKMVFGVMPNIIVRASDIGKFTALTDFNVYGATCSGSVEEIVAGQIDNGRTPGDNVMRCPGLLRAFTFGGNLYNDYEGLTDISFESKTKILLLYHPGGSLTPTVFISGYTVEETQIKYPDYTIIKVD